MATLAHTDAPIGPASPAEGARSVLEGFDLGDYVGNPLYGVVDEHVAIVVLVLLTPLLIWGAMRAVQYLARRGFAPAVSLAERWVSAPMRIRVASVAVAWSGCVHFVLAFTHEPSGYTVAYLGGAGMLGWASWSLLGARRRLAVAFVVLSIVGFWFLGSPPDQVGILTKIVEVFALALVAHPRDSMSRRRRLAPSGVVGLLVVTGLAAWIGAFASAGAEGGHHGGEFPDPGTLVPYIEQLEPTVAQRAFADEVHRATVAAVRRYEDPAVAEAAGYQVGTVRGLDHHAQNPSLVGDGRVLDPEYPESLIYAETASGPVLVGVMFETDGIGERGPMDGGSIMVWHSHENVCFSLTPPAVAGLESPFGLCPVGSFNIPRTAEMLHAWTIQGVPDGDRWGHLDEGWLEDRLATGTAAADR